MRQASLQVGAAPSLDVEGTSIPLILRVNRRARRLIVRVMHQTGEVVVVAPSRRALKDALRFAETHRGWIAAQLKKVPPLTPFAPGVHVPFAGRPHLIVHRPKARAGVVAEADLIDGPMLCASGELDFVPRRIEDFMKREARRFLVARTAQHCAALGLKAPRVALRDQVTRWGSCSRASGISYSWRLIMAPPEVADSVAAHEVAHLVHMNHSKAFWKLVETLVPNLKDADAWLTNHGRTLHRYGARPGR
jgi:predicted metal-dependent hydrolase